MIQYLQLQNSQAIAKSNSFLSKSHTHATCKREAYKSISSCMTASVVGHSTTGLSHLPASGPLWGYCCCTTTDALPLLYHPCYTATL